MVSKKRDAENEMPFGWPGSIEEALNPEFDDSAKDEEDGAEPEYIEDDFGGMSSSERLLMRHMQANRRR
jgi:hypothetical protein